MSSEIRSLGSLGTYLQGSLDRFVPEPKNRLGFSFQSVLKGLGTMISNASPVGGVVDTGYQDLLNKQIEVQQQMLLVSFESNIEKSKHETQMSAVRNIRVA